ESDVEPHRRSTPILAGMSYDADANLAPRCRKVRPSCVSTHPLRWREPQGNANIYRKVHAGLEQEENENYFQSQFMPRPGILFLFPLLMLTSLTHADRRLFTSTYEYKTV